MGADEAATALAARPAERLRPILQLRHAEMSFLAGRWSSHRVIAELLALLTPGTLPESCLDEATAMTIEHFDLLDCPDLASEVAEKVRRSHGQLLRTELALARCRFRRSDPIGLTAIEELAALHPTSSDAGLAVAEARLLLGDPTAASAAAAVSPDDPNWVAGTRLRADALWLANDLIGAATALAELVDHRPKSERRALDGLRLAEVLIEARHHEAGRVLHDLVRQDSLESVQARAQRLLIRHEHGTGPPVARLAARFEPTTRAAEPPIIRLARSLMPASVRRSLATQASARPHRSLAAAAASLRSSGIHSMRIELRSDSLPAVLEAGQPIAVMAHTPRGLLPALIAAVDTTTRSVQLVDPATSRPLPLLDLDLDLDPTVRGGLILVPGDDVAHRLEQAEWHQPIDAADLAIGDRRLGDLTDEEIERVVLLRRNASELASSGSDTTGHQSPHDLSDLTVAADVEQLRRSGDSAGFANRIATELLHRPDSAVARSLWASHLVQSGRSSEAVLALASMDAQSPAVQVAAARVERALGRFDIALELLDSAIQTDPADLDALIERADLTVTSVEAGRTADIVADPRGVLGLGVTESTLSQSLNRLIEMSTVEIAVLEERFDHLEAVALLGGRLSLAVGQLDDAEASFSSARTRSATLDLCQAVLTDLKGGFNADIHHGLVSEHPHDVRVWALTVGSALRRGQLAEAERLHREAMAAELKGFELLAPLGDRLASLKDRQVIEPSHNIEPGDSPAAGQA